MRNILPERKYTRDNVIERLLRSIEEDNALELSGSRCAEELTAAVSIAVAHARTMVDALGEPFMVERNRGRESALGPVLFDSRQDALAALRNTSKIKEIFADANARECVFALTMHRFEYDFFGTESAGEMVRRDVLQKAVEFTDHHVSCAAMSMEELGWMLAENVVKYLATFVPKRRLADEKTRSEMRHSEELLTAQLKTLHRALQENQPFAGSNPLRAKMTQGKEELASLRGELSSLFAKKPSRDRCLGEIQDILRTPGDHIRLECIEMRVGDFGIKSDTGVPLKFHECSFGDGQRLAVFIAAITRENAVHIWPELELSPSRAEQEV